MRRALAWLGVAVLAASWLPGVGLYHLPSLTEWCAMALVGVAAFLPAGWALSGRAGLGPATKSPREAVVPGALGAALLAAALLAAALWAPWPYRLSLLLLAASLPLHLPFLPRFARAAGWAMLAAALVLLVQCLVLMGYIEWTARSSELGDWAGRLAVWAGRWLGVPLASGPGTINLNTMRQTHDFAITWSLLVDPVNVGFLAGALAWVLLESWAVAGPGRALRSAWRPGAVLMAATILYLPLRAGLMLALYMHRVLRTDYEAPLRAMDQFWSTWVLLAMQAVPVLLAWRLVRVAPPAEAAEPARQRPAAAPARRLVPAGALALLACAAFTAAVLLDPVGARKGGRVLVDEHHTDWEPTQRPYDTEWYGHLSGYNYACIYDYCSRFYRTARQEAPITPAALAGCDVLVIKTPLLRYSRPEIDAIEHFVRQGGGLLLIGEHTDVFGSGRSLNAVAQRFGFRFRYDCLFGVDSVFDDLWAPPLVPHPVVQHMPPMDFATSCSIDPQHSRGRSVITGVGLKNLPADYHALNLYPQVEDRPDMRYGAFVQLWSARHGAGRVLAFTDSTIFSNFSTFEPGKAELWMGMIEWLNRRDEFPVDLRWPLLLIGAVLAAGCAWAGFRVAAGGGAVWLVCLVCAVLGWAGTSLGVRAWSRAAMPAIQPERGFTSVVIDRTVCDARLSKGGFIGGKSDGFGIFERWLLRVGLFTSRRAGAEAFGGDLLVLMHPHLQADQAWRDALVRYVEGGGKLLVLDSPRNAGSTTNLLLRPMGLSLGPRVGEGTLSAGAGGQTVQVKAGEACEVIGGRPIATMDGKTVAAEVSFGRGTVTLVGFGSRFNDDQMGATGDVEPGPELRQVFDLEFWLVRHVLVLQAERG